jgi:hypothetical protein
MAIQIVKDQLASSSVDASKLDLTSGTFNFANATLQAANPTNASDVATKQFVENTAAGLDVKDSVKAATTASITLSGTQTIDGISILADDRVLVKNQGSSANGIYLCKASTWQRTTDLAVGADAAGSFCFVEQGTTNGDKQFVCTSNKGSAVVGTDAITFGLYGTSATINAGTGLTNNAGTFNVNVDNTDIQINGSDQLEIKACPTSKLSGTVPNNKLANDSVSLGGITVALGASDATPAFDLQDSTGYPAANLTGSIAASQLAGSIPNSKLSNDSISLGGITVALGASDATPAFDLQDSTGYPAANLTGSIAASQLAGSIPNNKLSNDSVSLGGVAVALGSSDATPAFDLQDSTGYPASALTGTVSNSQLAGSIQPSKLLIQTKSKKYTGNGSTLNYDLDAPLDAKFEQVIVFRNGLCVDQVASSPTGTDEYTVSLTGGGSGNGRITFGANIPNNDKIKIWYIA